MVIKLHKIRYIFYMAHRLTRLIQEVKIAMYLIVLLTF